MKRLFLLFIVLFSFSFLYSETSTEDTLSILNEDDCYNTGNCHYRFTFATDYYSFTPSVSSLYEIVVNVLDSENIWHNYYKTLPQCVLEGVCDSVTAEYIDFWFQHNADGNQYIAVEVFGNGDDAYDYLYHDVLIDYCYGVNCGTGGTCDGTSGYPVCSCEEGYILRGGICEEGWFGDENLAAAVVELLQYKGYDVETEADIDPEMLEDITHLPLRGKNISSLAGIGLFSSLSVLDVSENNISDLSPLAECTGLKVLNISNNPVNDLTPLSTLPLESLDISYSGVYNLNPLLTVGTLSELIFADTVNGRHVITRPDGSTVAAWLQNLSGCNGLIEFHRDGNTTKFGVIDVNGGCPAHGSCVDGRCVCDTGYTYHAANNTCFDPDNCGTGTHPNVSSGTCDSDIQWHDCGDLPENAKIASDSSLYWNTSTSGYGIPAGYTTDLCYSEDQGCADTICQWGCKFGYMKVGDSICAPNHAVRMIHANAYNQLILPDISRQDVALEPIPGTPSFVPVLKADIYRDADQNLVAGWHLDLPRAELLSQTQCKYVCATEWDQKTLYVFMPWGKEEYSIEAEKKCFDSDNEPMDCASLHIGRLEVTYYPAPGQNLFSYIVLETTGDAYKTNYGIEGRNFEDTDQNFQEDYWKITRYGNDGSVTEFERDNATRPGSYRFMDYIPVSKHTTRDGKEISFEYEFDKVTADSAYFYYNIRSVHITDPLQRVIEIKSSDPQLSGNAIPRYGLMGKPDPEHKTLYKPLEGVVEISAGRINPANSGYELKKVARYSNFDGFSMSAELYRSEQIYRRDMYSVNNGVFYLDSYLYSPQPPYYFGEFLGRTEWNIGQNGYTEKKLVKNDSGIQDYTVRRVEGKFEPAHQEPEEKYYSLSIPDNENLQHKTVTLYSQIKSGVTSSERIVEDYFTDWLQPAKRVTCKPTTYNDTDCTDNATAVREEIKYNVSGSPVYFRNADGQVTVNLYNTTNELNPDNYIIHFFSDPLNYSNAAANTGLPVPAFIRSDNLRRSGTMACSAVYSLDTQDSFDSMLSQYVAYGIGYDQNWCVNGSDRRVTNYEWTKQSLEKPYDLKTVTYPDGKERTFTYDYDISSFFQNPQPPYSVSYRPNGKVWGETITGSDSRNTLQSCYQYDLLYRLTAQGTGQAGNGCDYKKGFSFDSSSMLMTQDFSYNEDNRPVLENDYIYDYLGRKIAERNSAGVSTVYVYDSLDRVVFTFFGCIIDPSPFGSVYNPYNFDREESAGDDGRGVAFDYSNGGFPYARYINTETCEYYRKYKYDVMSNLTETYFFEYWDVNQNNQIFKNTASPKIIKQKTEYDMLGRAVKSCQYDGLIANPTDYDKRCIETEHDAFGNITRKTENGEERVITYDHRNRPLTVTVDGLQTEEYSYSNTAAGGYFGHDTIKNKYENIEPLKTYKDKWGRAAKSVDPFGNETETTYESSYSDNIISQTTTSSGTKTAETVWTYDDLDRKLSETRKQFIPGSESTTNVNHVTYWDYDSIGNIISVESSDGTKQTYSYDTLNRPVETVNYEKINSNRVEASSSENFYDTDGRLFRTETTRNNQTITEDYGFDTFGRITSVKTTDPANSSRYRVKFYNTGGQVIWEADEESDGSQYSFDLLDILNVEVGNQKYYTYNAFGDLEKTVYVMTDSGHGNNTAVPDPDLNPWLNNSQITTNFTYDIFGRITSRTNDRSGVTEYSYYPNNTTGSHRRNKLQSIQISPAVDNNSNYTDKTQTYTYTYDEYGDEASVEYTEGNSYSMEVDFTRDAYGRITSKTSNGSVPVTQTFTYNMRNLLETATDTVGNAAATSVTRLYDSFGNPYSESVSSGNVTKTVSRRMNDAKTYQFTYPDGKTLRKMATGNDLDSIEYNNSEIASYSRANGVLTAITKGQNLIETFSYNSWNMLDNHTISNANADVYDMSYNYSRGWHLIEKADGIKNTSDKYAYDSYYRLKEVKYDFANNTAARTDNFYQDGVHNIEQSTENGTIFAWGVDKLNRLRDKKVGGNTEVAYEYDERNNMISEDRSGTSNDRTYIYDDLNRLIEVKDGSNNTIAEYTYDAFNRRITKTVGNTTERYTCDDWNIVEISTNSNNYTSIIDSGTDRHIAIEVTANNTSTIYYFLTDERGNVTALTDANGNILERYRYRVYGDFEILDSQFTPKNCNNQTCYATNLHNFLWGGSLYEPETNLYWMRNRYYHIDMHRFINQDPIGIWGDANNLGNGFAYVAGMVIEASDPSGLEVLCSGNIENIKKRSYQYSIERGDSEKVATIKSEIAGGLATLRTDPPDNPADWGTNAAEIYKLIQELKNDEPTTTWEIWEKDKGIHFWETKNGDVLLSTRYTNPQTGEEKYEFEDGTVVLKSPNGEENCSGPSCGRLVFYPSEPDSTDGVQTYFANQFIKKILEIREKKSFFEMMEEGPVIKYDDYGRKVFIFNPYYHGKDPMKEIFWDTKNADGTKGFVRNPFVPGAEYGYDSTTYEKFQQSGFPQTNVDPYFE